MNINIEHKHFFATVLLVALAIALTYFAVNHYRDYQDLQNENMRLIQQTSNMVSQLEQAQAEVARLKK